MIYDVHQKESEQDEVHGIKREANSTGMVMDINCIIVHHHHLTVQKKYVANSKLWYRSIVPQQRGGSRRSESITL